MSRRRKPMSSLDWSRKFEVFSISRLVISSFGYQTEEIKALTDKDMQTIADSLQNGLHSLFTVALQVMVRQYMAEKKSGGQG